MQKNRRFGSLECRYDIPFWKSGFTVDNLVVLNRLFSVRKAINAKFAPHGNVTFDDMNQSTDEVSAHLEQHSRKQRADKYAPKSADRAPADRMTLGPRLNQHRAYMVCESGSRLVDGTPAMDFPRFDQAPAFGGCHE
jgi:hypothetical protein